MKHFLVVLAIALFVVVPIFAGCPSVYSIDDPPCVPYPLTYMGTYWGIQMFSDGSHWTVEGNWFEDCDEVNVYVPVVVMGYGGCPEPQGSPCIARDLLTPPR